jgi:hypothetical protein
MLRLLHPAWLSISCLVRKECWSSAQPVYKAMTTRQSRCEAHWSCCPLLTRSYRTWRRHVFSNSPLRCGLHCQITCRLFTDRGHNVLRINGLYRHGFLLTPVLVEEALALLSAEEQIHIPGRWPCLRERSPHIRHIGSHEEMSVCSLS